MANRIDLPINCNLESSVVKSPLIMNFDPQNMYLQIT